MQELKRAATAATAATGLLLTKAAEEITPGLTSTELVYHSVQEINSLYSYPIIRSDDDDTKHQMKPNQVSQLT